MKLKAYSSIVILFIVSASYLFYSLFDYSSMMHIVLFAFAAYLCAFQIRYKRISFGFIVFSLFMAMVYYYSINKGFTPVIDMMVFRTYFVEKAQYFHDMRYYAFIKSLMIGDRTLLDVGTKDMFRTTGCFHLIAISGLHFGIIAGVLHIILRNVSYRMRYCIIAGILLFYLMITGFPASAVRAYIMLIIYYIARIVFIRTHMMNIWGVATVIMVVINPRYFNDLGFWLSVISTLGLILALPYITATKNIIIQSFIISCAAQCALLPLLFYFFGYVNFLSPILNVAAGFLIIPITWIGFLFFLPLPIFITKILIFIDEKLSSILFFFIGSFDRNDLIIKYDSITLPIIVAYYCIWGIVMYLLCRKNIVKKCAEQ